MSDQYIPMIERISEEYDESDSNMVLELADTDQGYAALKQQMSELKHQYPFIEKLLEGDGEIRLSAQEHEILNQYFRLYYTQNGRSTNSISLTRREQTIS